MVGLSAAPVPPSLAPLNLSLLGNVSRPLENPSWEMDADWSSCVIAVCDYAMEFRFLKLIWLFRRVVLLLMPVMSP